MIIMDMNQIQFASMMMHLTKGKTDPDEDMVRYMILNSIRLYKKKFSDNFI